MTCPRAPLALLAASLLIGCAQPSATPCSHDEVLRMGAILHEQLDLGSGRLTSYDSIDAAKDDGYIATFEKLLDASDAALRGDDAVACRLYREIAADQEIDLD